MFLSACLFSKFHAFSGRVPTSNPEEDYETSEFDDEQEGVVSAIRSGALEKLRKKPILLMSDSFSWVYSPVAKELYLTPKRLDFDQNEDRNDIEENNEKEEFLSVKSCFSCCSSAVSRDVFLSVKASPSCSSTLDIGGGFALDLTEFQRRSIIQEFCQCEGWPFGLCRNAMLLPPLPKSPSESWSWFKKHQNY